MQTNKNISELKQNLIAELIGLAKACDGHGVPNQKTYDTIIDGMALTSPELSPLESELKKQIENTLLEKHRLLPSCQYCASPCGQNEPYDLKNIEKDTRDVQKLKYQLLSDLSILACHCIIQRPYSQIYAVNDYFVEALACISYGSTADFFIPVINKLSSIRKLID